MSIIQSIGLAFIRRQATEEPLSQPSVLAQMVRGLGSRYVLFHLLHERDPLDKLAVVMVGNAPSEDGVKEA